jgi:hypothetical protein
LIAVKAGRTKPGITFSFPGCADEELGKDAGDVLVKLVSQNE